MKISVFKTPAEMGAAAAKEIARAISAAIRRNGGCRMALSTGSSQFEMFEALVREPVEWPRVTMFHLDEYVGLPETHGASFRKYLKERFVSRVPLKKAWFVSGEGDVEANIEALSKKISEAPVDLGVIGIGENGHIAFNDPPADFDTAAPYKLVSLDDRCRRQQVGEGWFATLEDVPRQAVSMTVRQILSCKKIITVCPHAVKAEAIKLTLTSPEVTNLVPATILRTHPDWHLFIDEAAAALTPSETLNKEEYR